MAESIKIRTSKIPDDLTARELRPLLTSILADVTALAASVNQLITDYDAHVHGGITAGAANSAAPTATTADAVTLTLED